MRPEMPSVTLRIRTLGGFCLALAGFALCALGQTNVDSDILQTEHVHNLSPVAGFARLALWFLAAALLIVAGVVLFVRHRVATNLYKLSSDEQWKEDSLEDAAEKVDAETVKEACEVVEKGPQGGEVVEPEAGADQGPQARLFTPASGTAWREPMLKAFLGTCMKVNCLGRTWRESAARQVQVSNQPDPREAELIRRLMQRWQEFHVDPETGVFLERSAANGHERITIIGVVKDKRTLVEAAINAGFVIESLGRYLRSTDLVYRRAPRDYHAPTQDELTKMTPGERESMIRIPDIPDPWQAMIAGAELTRSE
jgi:hypothetical protein